MDFNVIQLSQPHIKNPVIISGLPGIGNVGKIAVDFIIDIIGAKQFIKISSHHFPNLVFVNERNLVSLPTVSLYHKRIKRKDFIFLAGDAQPIDEVSCYEFCEKILDIAANYGCKEIITLGGIGLNKIPKKPKVYVTGNDKSYVNSFKGCNLRIYGVVGPIIGVTGVLVGLAKSRKIPAAALLAQTFGHPAYLGIKGARELIGILNKRFGLKINVERLAIETEEIEEELRAKAPLVTEKPKKIELNYFG